MQAGSLRADQVTRSLVPALLNKADKLRRGKTTRTGGSDIEPAGLQEFPAVLIDF